MRPSGACAATPRTPAACPPRKVPQVFSRWRHARPSPCGRRPAEAGRVFPSGLYATPLTAVGGARAGSGPPGPWRRPRSLPCGPRRRRQGSAHRGCMPRIQETCPTESPDLATTHRVPELHGAVLCRRRRGSAVRGCTPRPGVSIRVTEKGPHPLLGCRRPRALTRRSRAGGGEGACHRGCTATPPTSLGVSAEGRNLRARRRRPRSSPSGPSRRRQGCGHRGCTPRHRPAAACPRRVDSGRCGVP